MYTASVTFTKPANDGIILVFDIEIFVRLDSAFSLTSSQEVYVDFEDSKVTTANQLAEKFRQPNMPRLERFHK